MGPQTSHNDKRLPSCVMMIVLAGSSMLYRIFPAIKKVDILLLLLACLSLILVFFRIEPSPADYVMMGASVGVAITVVLRRQTTPFGWSDVPLMGYFCLVAIQAAIFREHLDMRFALITIYLIASYFAMTYILSRNAVKGLRWMWWAYLAGSVITSLLLLYQLVDIYSLGGNWNDLYFGRPNAWFKDANVAGPFLLPAVYYCLFWFYRFRQWRYLGLFILLSMGLFCTFSRGAYMGLIGGVVLLSGLYVWKTWHQSGLWETIRLVGVAGLSVAVFWLGLQLYAPFRQLTNDRFGTLIKTYDTEGRVVSWQTSLKEISKQPLGSGSGSYESKSEAYQEGLAATPSATVHHSTPTPKSGDTVTAKNGQKIVITPSAHNTYLRVLLENGIIGLGLLLIFLTWLAFKGGLMVLKSGLDNTLYAYLAVSWVSLMVLLPMGTFIDTLHWRFLWIVAAAMAASLYLVDQERNNGRIQK